MTTTSGYTIDEQMLVCLARAFDVEGVAVGATVTAELATRLAKALYAPQLVLVGGPHSGYDVPVRPKVLDDEWVLAPLSVRGSDWQETFDLIGHQRYSVCIGAVQVDRTGAANVAFLGADWARPKVAMIGSRGLPDHAALTADHFFIHVRNHNTRTFVARVDFRASAPLRGPAGWTGVPRLVVTNLGVFHIDPDTRFMAITSLHEGVTFDQVQEATGFPLDRPDAIAVTTPPTEEELAWIRERIDPLSVRRLETQRMSDGLLAELLAAQQSVWNERPHPPVAAENGEQIQ